MPNLPGDQPKHPTSYAPPLLQVGLGLVLLYVAWWAAGHAQVVRATDAWTYNALSLITLIAGLLWLPFAIGALVVVVPNRRRRS